MTFVVQNQTFLALFGLFWARSSNPSPSSFKTNLQMKERFEDFSSLYFAPTPPLSLSTLYLNEAFQTIYMNTQLFFSHNVRKNPSTVDFDQHPLDFSVLVWLPVNQPNESTNSVV